MEGAEGLGGSVGESLFRRPPEKGFGALTMMSAAPLTVEPVFGQIKQGRGFRQFLLRGLAKVNREWLLICAGNNLLKLFRFGAGISGKVRGKGATGNNRHWEQQ